jgi:hypothetical protein
MINAPAAIPLLTTDRINRPQRLAQQLLMDWQAQDPGSDLATWGAEFFSDCPTPLLFSLKDLDCRVLTALARAGQC